MFFPILSLICNMCFKAIESLVSLFLQFGFYLCQYLAFINSPTQGVCFPNASPLFVFEIHTNILNVSHTNPSFIIWKTHIFQQYPIMLVTVIPHSPKVVVHEHLDLFKNCSGCCCPKENVIGDQLQNLFNKDCSTSLTQLLSMPTCDPANNLLTK